MMNDPYNTMRRPAPASEIIPSQFAPAMQMPPMLDTSGGNEGIGGGSINALAGLGKALYSRMEQHGQAKRAGGRTDAPMPQMKRPFEVGPPFETNA